MRRLLSLAPVVLSISTAALAEPSLPVAADTPATTASAKFTVPTAWTLTQQGALSLVAPPETDSRIAIVDVGTAADARAATAKAWQLYRSAANRPVKLITPRAPKDGWEERQIIEYEVSPNEMASIYAAAFRRGTAWTVMIEDASQATDEKRGAAFNLIAASLRPVGYARESFAGRTAHPLDTARIAELRDFVETSIRQLGVPGAAIALIDHDQIVYEGGVGVRTLGKPDPVGAHTRFMIASNTKGMATLLLAKQVDAGKARWDEAVTDVYPAFRLGSEATTKKVLLRHLVCACTGLPRKDLDWVFNTTRATPASVTFTQLAATEPTSAFGEVFQYNNLMASAAGYIAGHLVYPKLELGAAFDAAMQSQIFAPLGMKDTTFDFDLAQRGDFASPHGDDVDGKPAVASMAFNYAVRPYRPAGGAFSTAHDVALYVLNELREGKLAKGGQLISPGALLERRKPGVPTGEDETYGMGLENNTVWGVRVVHHGGSMGGFKTDFMFLPEAGIGAVVLTNADNGRALLRPFMRRLLEVVYDGKPEAAADVTAVANLLHARRLKDRERLVVPADTAVASGLAPVYSNPDLGRLTVKRTTSGTTFDFGLWDSVVASRKNDDGTLSLITIDPTDDGLEFVQGVRDGKRVLLIRDGQHEYIYTEGG